jgi:F0F1-type ATP synthase membrane subunit b/b'
MKLIIQLLLWVVIIFLGYLVFNAVYDPVQFNKVKEKRYAKVIERLEDIRAAQIGASGSYRTLMQRILMD